MRGRQKATVENHGLEQSVRSSIKKRPKSSSFYADKDLAQKQLIVQAQERNITKQERLRVKRATF